MKFVSYLLVLATCCVIRIRSLPSGYDLIQLNPEQSKLINRSRIDVFANDNTEIPNLATSRQEYYSGLEHFNQNQLGDEIKMLLRTFSNPKKTFVGMVSVYREHDEYLYKTLSSVLPALFSSNITSSLQNASPFPPKLSIFLGSPSSEYLKFTKYNSLIDIIPMEEKFWNAPFGHCTSDEHHPERFTLFKDHSVRVRSTLNYVRMMEGLMDLISKESSSTNFEKPIDCNNYDNLHNNYGVLLLEDDIIMMPDSATRLDDTISAVEKVIGKDADYILSCYVNKRNAQNIGGYPSNYKNLNPSMNDFSYYHLKTAPDQFSRYDFNDPKGFTGMLCIYMPMQTIKKASDWLRKNYLSPSSSGRKKFLPSDFQLGDFSLEFNIPILAMHEPLAQHIGKSSTGLSGHFQQGIGLIEIKV